MRLLLPSPALVAAAGVVETVAIAGAALFDEPATHSALLSVLAGIATAIPIVVTIAVWFGKDHFALKEMHAENRQRLDHLIEKIEGTDGLWADRQRNRDRRHEQRNMLQVLTLRVRLLERHAERSGYEPPEIEDIPQRRGSDQT